MKEKFLFVGGSVDGHMIEVDGGYPYWHIPILSEYDDGQSDELFHMVLEKEIYRKIKWQSGDKSRFEFFALENLSNHEVMQMILNNYQPFKQAEEFEKIKSYETMLERCVEILENFLRSPLHTSNKMLQNVYDFIYDIEQFLFNDKNRRQNITETSSQLETPVEGLQDQKQFDQS